MLHVKYLSNKLIGAKSRLYTFMLLTNNLKKHSTAITQVLNRNQQQQRKSRPDKQTRRLHLLTSNVCASEYTLGHPHKMFRFPSPDRPMFLEKLKKKKIQNHL